jgi:hypothetical protein
MCIASLLNVEVRNADGRGLAQLECLHIVLHLFGLVPANQRGFCLTMRQVWCSDTTTLLHRIGLYLRDLEERLDFDLPALEQIHVTIF